MKIEASGYTGHCIYKIENILTNDFYIGSCINFRSRLMIHSRSLDRGKHHSIILQRAYEKYGSENFLAFIIEEVENKKELLKREQFYLNTLEPNYNVAKIAGSSLGIKRRPETIEKLVQIHTGEKHPKWRNEIKSKAQGGDNHWTKKKGFSDESRKNMSEAQKKLYKNGYVNPNKGRKASEKENKRNREKNFIPVIQMDLEGKVVNEWKSAILVEEELGIKKSNVSFCCKNPHRTAGGFKWRYKNKKEKKNGK